MKYLTILITAVGPIIWGTTYLLTSEYLPEGKPLLSAFVRAFPAGILLIAISRALPQKNEWFKLAILGFLNIGLFQTMLFISAYRLPGGIASIVSAIQPLIVIFLLWSILKQTISKYTIICSIMSLVGLSMLILSQQVSFNLLGIVAALVGAISVGLGTFLSKQWQSSLSISGFTGWQLAFGSLTILPLGLWFELPIQELTTTHIFAYGYLIVFGGVISYLLWFRGISKLSAVTVSSLGLLSPITASAIGWLALGQSLNTVAVVGILLVLSSLVTIQITIVE